jgi:hypothetical protein
MRRQKRRRRHCHGAGRAVVTPGCLPGLRDRPHRMDRTRPTRHATHVRRENAGLCEGARGACLKSEYSVVVIL